MRFESDVLREATVKNSLMVYFQRNHFNINEKTEAIDFQPVMWNILHEPLLNINNPTLTYTFIKPLQKTKPTLKII